MPSEIKYIAAYGGLVLGLFNLGVSLYKEFFKKGKLKILEAELIIREGADCSGNFQLNLRLHAVNDNIYIKQVQLTNESQRSEDKIENSFEIDIKEALPYKNIDIFQHGEKEYTVASNELFILKAILLSDLKIETGSNKSLTFVGTVTSQVGGPGSTRIPKEGWSIKVRYNRRVNKKKIKRAIIKNYA